MSKKFGIRTAEVIQQPDKHGKSFFFRINGMDIFCGGSCWIPADSLLPSISAERYRNWIELMVEGRQIMIRYGTYPGVQKYANCCTESGVVESTKTTPSMKPATSLACWSGRTSCLAAATIQPRPRSSNRYSRRRCTTFNVCGITHLL